MSIMEVYDYYGWPEKKVIHSAFLQSWIMKALISAHFALLAFQEFIATQNKKVFEILWGI